MKARRALLKRLIEEFPNAPALTLARIAYQRYPESWASVEHARDAIRYFLGLHGKRSRQHHSDKSLHRPKRDPGKADWAEYMPKTLAEPWEEFPIPGKNRVLIISDIHIPFHDRQALEIALKDGERRQPTIVLLNGDVMDHYSMSRFETDPKLRDFPAEVRAGRLFFSGLRKRFPRARIILKEGNHENRLTRYLRLKAPELLGVPDFEWESIFGLDDLEIEYVKDMRPIKLGKLTVLHGHEYVFQIANPVNPARGLFLRGKSNALCGHFHMSSQHSEKSLEQKVISTWSVGCLCDLHPAYRPLNQWNHGFAFVTVDRDGGFHVENFRILDGRVW